MRRLVVRKQISLALRCLPLVQAVYPNLVSLRIVIFNGSEFADPNPGPPFEAVLIKLRHLEHLCLTTPKFCF
ncbi:hypothetical protein B0H66DRAFT_544986 [Apodospora peruviana]|uniref:Secreted protein n=1 Tax=Apodospora peruviana TaxID=516989 RepID=A0AAE0MFZ6_9PEZI|nr:hypothetical protein B0H66DRAFT_544986 [Apodospora peruviana]